MNSKFNFGIIALVIILFPSLMHAASLDFFTTIQSDGYIKSDASSIDIARMSQAGSERTDYLTFAGVGSYNYTGVSAPMTYRLYRSYLSFPIVSLPDNAVVTSASVFVFIYPHQSPDNYSYLRLLDAKLASPHALSTTDFDAIGDINNPQYISDKTIFQTDVYAALGQGELNEFPLNQLGIDKLKNGYLSVGIVDGHDIEAKTPSQISTYATQSLFSYAWEMRDRPAPGSYYGNLPFLRVNYYVPSNLSPVFDTLSTINLFEGATLTLDASATDPDGDALTYSVTDLPSGATYDSATGLLSWTPSYDDAGTYTVTLAATDDGEPSLTATTSLTITVLNANRAPILSPVGNQVVAEGQALSFTLIATDPDGDVLTYAATNLPSGATFSGNTFTWTPDYNDAGNYENIEFSVSDNGSPMELDLELITISVGDVNRPPVLTNPGPQAVLEEDSLSFSLSATDPDGDSTSITATNLPSAATFANGSFNWIPTLSDAGVYTVTFTTTDSGSPAESVVIDVVITVGDNPTPIEQAEDLIEDVVIIDLPQNIENAYMANLQKVGTFIAEGKVQAALNQLQAFLNKIRQDYNQGILTSEEYQVLFTGASNLVEDLGG